MKSFKYCELPKCDTDIDWANAVGKMAPKDLSDAGLPQTFDLQNNTLSAKCNKARCNKMR